MTIEEQTEFKEKIKELIMPYAMNMTEEQIKNIISIVVKENSELPKGFGAMLYEQIILNKYKK